MIDLNKVNKSCTTIERAYKLSTKDLNKIHKRMKSIAKDYKYLDSVIDNVPTEFKLRAGIGVSHFMTAIESFDKFIQQTKVAYKHEVSNKEDAPNS